MRPSSAIIAALFLASACAPAGTANSPAPQPSTQATPRSTDAEAGASPSCAPHVEASYAPAAPPVALPSANPAISTRDIPLEAGGVGRVIAAGGRLWIMSFDGALAFDPSTEKLDDYAGLRANAVTSDGSRLWIASFEDGRVRRVDPADGKELWSTVVPGNPEDVELAEGGLWVAQHRRGSVTRLDPETGAALATVNIPCAAGSSGPDGLGRGSSGLWLTIPNISSVALIDPRSNTLAALIRMTRPPCDSPLEVGPAVWTGSCEDAADVVARIDPATRQEVSGVSLGRGTAPFLVAGRIWLKAGPDLLRLGRDGGTIDRVVRLSGDGDGGTVVEAFGSVWLVGPAAIRKYPRSIFER